MRTSVSQESCAGAKNLIALVALGSAPTMFGVSGTPSVASPHEPVKNWIKTFLDGQKIKASILNGNVLISMGNKSYEVKYEDVVNYQLFSEYLQGIRGLERDLGNDLVLVKKYIDPRFFFASQVSKNNNVKKLPTLLKELITEMYGDTDINFADGLFLIPGTKNISTSVPALVDILVNIANQDEMTLAFLIDAGVNMPFIEAYNESIPKITASDLANRDIDYDADYLSGVISDRRLDEMNRRVDNLMNGSKYTKLTSELNGLLAQFHNMAQIQQKFGRPVQLLPNVSKRSNMFSRTAHVFKPYSVKSINASDELRDAAVRTWAAVRGNDFRAAVKTTKEVTTALARSRACIDCIVSTYEDVSVKESPKHVAETHATVTVNKKDYEKLADKNEFDALAKKIFDGYTAKKSTDCIKQILACDTD